MRNNPHFHIALFLPSLEGGGAQRITLSLAQGLLQVEGVKVDLVLGQAHGSFLKDVPAGVRLVDLKRSRMLYTILPLARYLRAERPDAMVSALDYANVAAILSTMLSGTGIRSAIVTHTHLSSSLAVLSKWKRGVFRCLLRATYSRAHAIIAVSRGVAKDMAHFINIPLERIRVIYNPVIESGLLTGIKEAVNHPWLCAAEPPVVLAVGRLAVEKDYSTLIHGFALLREQHAARLIILGEGDQRSQMQGLVSRLQLEDCVDLPGFTSNPRSFMQHAAVVALSSRWEALPTVLIEALHCGARIVSTDCPCGPGEILAQGKYGRLVPPGDVAAMAKALGEAIHDKTPLPAAESWQPYLIETAVRQYLDVFGIRAQKTLAKAAP